MSLDRRPRPGYPWAGTSRFALAIILCCLVGMALTACGDGSSDSLTPPPATIIRAVDSEQPTAVTNPGQVATPLPMPPTRPQVPAGSADAYPTPPSVITTPVAENYPLPGPVHTAVPFVYPAP